MISWLLIIILSYFLFSLSAFGDKLILSGPPKPISYVFYVGILNALVVLIIPFIYFIIPSPFLFLLIIIEAIIFILAMYIAFSAVEKFDITKVATTIGAIQPIFVLILAWIFWGSQIFNSRIILAFLLLLLGSFIISLENNYKRIREYIKIVLIASFLFSLDYVLSKFIFMQMPFLQAFIWMRIFAALFVLIFLFSKKNRKEIFGKNSVLKEKVSILFFFTQLVGGAAVILQAFAVYLVPIGFLPIINSLRGVQYIFLFLITLFFSIFLPKIFSEEISKKIILQKIIAIFLIIGGLVLVVFV